MKTLPTPSKGYCRLVPSVTGLVEFEAIARLGSFTLVAHELDVTQSAVSRQVTSSSKARGLDHSAD